MFGFLADQVFLYQNKFDNFDLAILLETIKV